MAELDLAVLERDLEYLLVEWRTWIGGHNRQARQILTKLLIGRLTFTPKIESGSAFLRIHRHRRAGAHPRRGATSPNLVRI